MNALPCQTDGQPTAAEDQPQSGFTLNTHAAALLERWCQQHGHDPADVVNAAVTCTLCGFTAARRTLGECLEDARTERLQTPMQEVPSR